MDVCHLLKKPEPPVILISRGPQDSDDDSIYSGEEEDKVDEDHENVTQDNPLGVSRKLKNAMLKSSQ